MGTVRKSRLLILLLIVVVGFYFVTRQFSGAAPAEIAADRRGQHPHHRARRRLCGGAGCVSARATCGRYDTSVHRPPLHVLARGT